MRCKNVALRSFISRKDFPSFLKKLQGRPVAVFCRQTHYFCIKQSL